MRTITITYNYSSVLDCAEPLSQNKYPVDREGLRNGNIWELQRYLNNHLTNGEADGIRHGLPLR